MNDEPTPDLDTATNAELVDALRARMDDMFFVGRPKSRDGEAYDWLQSWAGPSFYASVGLAVCSIVQMIVADALNRKGK